MTDLLILWHMHQPRYVHPATGRPVLPWVRLHAASGYLDMARALERHPNVRVTVNFVPVLVEQIEALVAGTRDALEVIAEKPASELSPAERRLVVARSFSVRRDRHVATRPRYAELLALRGPDERPEALADAATRFHAAELRDVQCLFLLAWLGFAAREDDPAIAELDAKGRLYTEEDKRVLLVAARRAAAGVLPAWRRLRERGQVELSTSPYYHPIIPLLIDSDCAKRSRPGDALPPRFSRIEDARAQILMARQAHERVFGAAPTGMWPPEGSISPEAVELYGECGVRWLAADEETLERSADPQGRLRALAAPSAGEAGQGPPRRRARGQIWRWRDVDLVFRDRELSDRIGFRYADVAPDAAAADLVAATSGGGVIGLFLDGENAWESYPGRGARFLDALYAALEREEAAGRARSRTISDAIAERGPGERLERLHSGSWIDATFRIWIGDPVKNRAWTHLGEARERVAAARAAGKEVARAERLLYAAEGSDWFWWFGEPFSSAEDPVFDELYRAHLAAAWRAIGEEPPAALGEPLYTPGTAPHRGAITGLLSPKIDGKAERFYEWHGAARFDVGRGGAMAEASTAVERVHVGFDHANVYLRLDPAPGHRRRLTGATMALRVRSGEHETRVRVLVGAADGGPELRALGGRVAAQDVVELALPRDRVGARPRDELQIAVSLEFAGVKFSRVPRDGFFGVVVPWPGWEDENWNA